jgi:GNAT superfamily N-acetyltransferase
MSEFIFSVRLATADDLDALVQLRMDFLREVNGRELENMQALHDNLHAYFARHLPSGDFLAWLAETESEIIGTSGLVFSHRPPSFNNTTGLDAYVMNMYTLPAWRGRGVARTLLHHLLEYVRTTPCRHVSLHATEQGRPLYDSMGFRQNDEVMELLL